MKKNPLLLCMIVSSLFAVSQERVPLSMESANFGVPLSNYFTNGNASEVTFNPHSIATDKNDAPEWTDETYIIETVYDRQTTGSLSNRFWIWDDGTMAAVATRGMNWPEWDDKGTGYNFYNGSQWGQMPVERIENISAGSPAIAPWGVIGEIVVAHSSEPPYLLRFSKREIKGTGQWDSFDYPGPGGSVVPTGARIAASGPSNRYLHLFYNTSNEYEGQHSALLYSRYDRQEQAWDIQDQIIEGTGANSYRAINLDSYTIATKGHSVAVLFASAWHDLFMVKSSDNGNTWQKTVIWEHPYPFFNPEDDITNDTLFTVDNSASIALDDNAMAHVVWGVSRFISVPELIIFPFIDGIAYWNENMPPLPDHPENVHHTLSPDYLYDQGLLVGWAQDVNGSGNIDFEGTDSIPFGVYPSWGVSTMPSISINNNKIALAYSSVTELYVTVDGTKNLRHIWLRFSYDGGQTWGDFYDIQADNIFHLYDECIYPVLAPRTCQYSANSFQLIYQADNLPGLAVEGDHPPAINSIIHAILSATGPSPGLIINPSNLCEVHDAPGLITTQYLTILNDWWEPNFFEITITYPVFNGASDHNSIILNEANNSNWLSVSPSSALLGPGQSITVEVTYNSSELLPGSYGCLLTFGASGTPQAPAYLIVNDFNALPPVAGFTCQYAGLNLVNLTWEPPNVQLLRYDDGANYSGIGGPGEFSVAARWSPEQLANYGGWLLTHILFFPTSPEADYTIKVWTGENAGTLLASQPVEAYTPNQWNKVLLETPVNIDPEQWHWIGYHVEAHGPEFPAGCAAGPAIAGFGDLISLDGVTWESLSGSMGMDYNWNIAGVIVPGRNSSAAGYLPDAYNVYRNNELIATLPASETEYNDEEAPANEPAYSIGAVYPEYVVLSDVCIPSSVAWIDVDAESYNIQLIPDDSHSEQFMIHNSGHLNSALNFQIETEFLTERSEWLSVYPESGQIIGQDSATIALTINATGLTVGDYSATVKITSDAVNTQMIEIPVSLEVTTSVDQLKDAGLMLYPNPTSGIFTIHGSENQAKITVFNTHGVEVYYEEQALPAVIDLTEQPRGVYLVKVEMESKYLFEKMIIH